MANLKIDIPLDQFLSQVVARNTNPDGSQQDPNLLRRMDNDICRKCWEGQNAKYPGQSFNVQCQGIWDERDYLEIQQRYMAENPGEEMSLEEIREIYDLVFWAEKYIVVRDDYGDMGPFKARWYQAEGLRCTAMQKVDRWSRGLGKTICGVIKELHAAITRKQYDIMVVCPSQAQSELWWEEINFQLDNSPALKDCIAGRKKQPFYLYRFYSGSTISIFTAGSKSGRGADAVRGQSPRRVRLDEQDYLVDKDYQAIMPIATRFANSEFHGSSTPTGLRQMYWQMCTKMPHYREFFYPVTCDPKWGADLESRRMAEAGTMDKYRHEFLAEFGDPESGLFKGIFVDQAKRHYTDPRDARRKGYDTCEWSPAFAYVMGVDWNGKGTGSKIRVLEYDPSTQVRRCVAALSVDTPGSTMQHSMDAIRDLNRKWRCQEIYIDFGFGFGFDEIIRKMGEQSEHPADHLLKNVTVIDFGATLKFNRLVPKRENSKYIHHEENELERRTKPFMVDGCVRALESSLVIFSDSDFVLDDQMRGYRVKSYSVHGYPNTYEPAPSGDHDLDAWMLAMLACEMRYGLFQTHEQVKRLVNILHVSGFGVPRLSPDAGQVMNNPLEARRAVAGVPSRSQSQQQQREEWRMQYLMRNGAVMTPVRGGSNNNPGQPPSRTSVFRRPSRTRNPWGSYSRM